MTRRIVFVAIVGRTGELTTDDRILEAPDGPVLHGKYPLPVLGPPTYPGGGRQTVGEIEQVAVCDRRIIVFGHLSTKAEFAHYAEHLATGDVGFELVLSHLKVQTERSTVFATKSSRFSEWSVHSVVIGNNPCWDLPLPQIEELVHG